MISLRRFGLYRGLRASSDAPIRATHVTSWAVPCLCALGCLAAPGNAYGQSADTSDAARRLAAQDSLASAVTPAADTSADELQETGADQDSVALPPDSVLPDTLAAAAPALPAAAGTVQANEFDQDLDGIPDLIDLCADSEAGVRVDDMGCAAQVTPWWMWAGAGAGALLLSWMAWTPIARARRRRKAREARLAFDAERVRSAQASWQRRATDPPLESPRQVSPRVGPVAPPEQIDEPSVAESPIVPTVGAEAGPAAPPPSAPTEDAEPAPPAPGGTFAGPPPGDSGGVPAQPGWNVGVPDPHAAGPPPPAGFPAERPEELAPLPGTVPQGPPAAVPNRSPFVSTARGHSETFDKWHQQPLAFEEVPPLRERLGWFGRHPLLSLALLLAAGVGAAVWMVRGPQSTQATPTAGVQPPPVTTVSLLPSDSTGDTVTTGGDRIPAALRMMEGDAQTARVGQTLPTALSVRVEDVDGQPVAGVGVLFEATVGGGLVRPVAVQTDTTGLARTFWTLGPEVITQYAVARVAGSEAGVAFEAQATPGLASRIAVARGSGQSAPPGQPLDEPVVFRVEGANGEPLEGIALRIVTDGTGTATPEEAVSDTVGEVSVAWTLGQSGDSTVLRAEVVEAPGIGAQAVAQLVFPSLPARSGVVAGGTHTCALSGDGTLNCWGGNQAGQLGTGGGRSAAPARVAADRRFAEVSAGLSHTCALEQRGTLYCWGDNGSAQLGDGSRIRKATPAPVAADVRFRTVSAGNGHTCAISRDGTTYCWGSNVSGQLGDGTRTDRQQPSRVADAPPLTQVAVGWFHTCGLTTDGRARCWGRNAFGQLGDGSTQDRATPVATAGGNAYRTLAAGGAHTCGLGTDGTISCWGQNNFGQLGDGGTAPLNVPTPVPGGPWRALTVGGVHTCALDGAGNAYCWGRNTYGQLGTGDLQDRGGPTPVEGGLEFASIQASGAHTCASTAAGARYCWGYNVEGQLGDGTRENRSVPTRVGG